jgi:RNA polymerase sigma factor (sigma-70 family)
MIRVEKRSDASEAGRDGSGVPDAELVAAARRGDKRAFVEIVARYQAMVCGIALGILGDFTASEDAGQEAFLTAWRKMDELREAERLRGWLAQIARNAALGQLRRRRASDGLDEAVDVADETPRPDDAAASREEAALVRESLAKLPETYRLPLILFYREGQSVRDVAEALGIGEEAVKQRLARGREMLRDRMAGLVESVMTRTGPTAIFTMTVAAAIGALAAPAAVAASVFGSASTAVSATSSSTVSSSLVTAMSTSKSFLITAAIVTALCIPVGYQIKMRREAWIGKAAAGMESEVVATQPQSWNRFENSALFREWRELHEKYGTNGAAMRVLYKVVGSLKDPFRRRAFEAALIAEWVEVDAAGGLAFFTAKEANENHRRQFLEEWLARDANGAVEALLASKPGWEEMARECLPEIARRVPGRLAEVASRLPAPEGYYDRNVRDAFAIVAEGGLANARAAAEAVTGPSRAQALGGVAQVWAKSDFDGAIAWARKLGTDRDEVIREALFGKAAVDPVAALEAVGMVPAGGRYAHGESTTGARVLIEAAKSDFDGTVAWITAHPGRFGREELMGLSFAVTARLNEDTAGFLSTQVANGSLAALLPAIESALLNNAGSQKPAVWEWLKMQPESDATKSLKKDVLSFAGYHDPLMALQMVADVPRNAEGDSLIKDVARSLFNGGRELSRFDKLMAQAPERLREPLLDAAFHYLSADNLEDPQKWIERVSRLPDASRAKGMEAIGRAWAQQTPEESVAWAISLPPGADRTGAEAAIAKSWGAKDPAGAAEWVAAMPSGLERDRSAGSLVAAIAERFPSEAWRWALSIDDAGERLSAASETAKAMAARDPATAREWIAAGPFNPEAKATLESVVQQATKRVR